LPPIGQGVAERFAAYFELLNRWNAKLNLTAIRSPEEILQRHFVECIFCSQHLPAGISTLLDYGSGAGFPGVPIALCRPEIRVTLAESQGKKAGFLREAVRSLGIVAEVHGGRVEEMPANRVFDAVALRAVDKMQEAGASAARRVASHGWLVLLAGAGDARLPEGFVGEQAAIPGSQRRVVVTALRGHVPRGTSA
jgi:16S rRNA (guanine527-N7)-methyltransferase